MFPELMKKKNMKAAEKDKEKGKKGLSLLGVDDFEKRGFKILDANHRPLTGLDALLAVTDLASQFLREEEEEIVKQRQKRLLREKALERPIMKKKRFLDDDKEWVHKDYSRFKKRILRSSINDKVQEMPENMRKLIDSMNGNNIMIVIRKKLFFTDTNGHYHRMSIPEKQVRSANFLTPEEKEWVNNEGGEMTPLFIQPSLAVSELVFKRWTMAKSDSNKCSYVYVLTSGWNDVISANHLKQGDQVQLWSFRINHQLCLALARVAANHHHDS
ncbi:hypothetical protein Ddye_022955 [Dipteronia dyeriana]|uniref:TF-B3 domain-containing protein n=1 Tax=Dipteronia dyeriana TaxID=168575 RepID=A0AAD9WSV9_9ROSI|nr:hypothetical protein Ddye_022955 [Dipteronia dyeriana]